ncbi:putative HMP/thiamine permease protein YkoE [bioreactor metagenome]|jgi:energy-coupling factor transport system substrate-specific component|uniref:Putative HMP/thiamine permease protein YkoE n=1 Tax=bioreactor metagenome TaxID=1076179 RepID=A0A645F3F7_9ZZZZ|nr:ECF transporter S component [Propionibacteriaceae bacterium]
MSESNGRLQWRVVDMVTAAILGVACGVIFLVWNQVGGAAYSVIDAATPGFGGLVAGIWLLGGVLGGLVIRKPGAAVFVEVLAAVVSMALGSQWGISTVYSGIVQGLGAELVFLIFGYRKFNLPVAMLAGAGAGVAAWVFEGFFGSSPNFAKTLTFNLIYLSTMIVTGLVLAGLVGWLLVRGLAQTGALDRFAAGREIRGRV